MEYCSTMRRKKTVFLFILIIILAISCHSGPKEIVHQPQTAPPAEVIPIVVVFPTETVQPVEVVEELPVEEELPPPEVVEHPVIETEEVYVVTQEQYDATMIEVQHFIDNLNRIISSRNYGAWKAVLCSELFEEISSTEYLSQLSESPAMKTRRIVLRTAEDYFIHVVVPSRANSRVDDIEFFGRNRVKAFTVNTNRAGDIQRLVLYDLEKVDNSWIIIN